MSWFITDTTLYSLLQAMNNTLYQQQLSMTRLSTGSRINSASDDPAGLIALTSLNSELTSIQSAYENSVQANAMLETADGALSQISDLVSTIYSLTLELANDSSLSESERQAKQLEIDQAVASIDRIVNTTTYKGHTLLNGTYQIYTSGVDTSKITDTYIYSRNTVSGMSFELEVVSAAEKAQLSYTSGSLTTSTTIEIAGNKGSVSLSFSSGTTINEIASSVNANTAQTGVVAVVSGGVLYLQSQYYGEDEFVSVDVISGTFNLEGGQSVDYGDDANITVNGQAAAVDGYDLDFNLNGVSGHLVLSESFISTAGSSTDFYITTGGARFSITPDVENTFTVGIPNVNSSHLGNGVVGYLSQIVSGGTYSAIDNPEQAVRIVEEAMSQIARTRANIGGFQTHTVGTMQNLLSEAEIAVSSAISDLNDTDYAYEIANLSRQQMLYRYQILALGLINQNSSSLLSLLN